MKISNFYKKIGSLSKTIRNLSLKPFMISLIALVVGTSTLAFYFYNKYNQVKQSSPQQETQSEVQRLVANVSKLILLPENETPTVATVSDPTLLRDQPFFARAKIGDKVLIYANARRAILYDPVENKILEVAPLNIGTPTPSPSPSPKKK
ncbi:MAG TPA: hypothetical protein VEK36_01350 [Candidatus Paceibacterota bacterium]|nr:hypothetical protein [Candidatus Paceibacterota bacterium]